MGEPNPTPEPRPSSAGPTFFSRIRRFELREAWWTLLDAWEAKPSFRRWAYICGAVLILVLAGWFLVYPHWARRNSVQMARQWIDAGQPAYAADVVQKALQSDPRNAELWRLAAELARRGGQHFMETQYRRQAFLVDSTRHELALEWASSALQSGLVIEADGALAEVSEAELQTSGFAQRLLGESARVKNHLPEAIRHFEKALALENGGAANLLPLGICLVSSGEGPDRQRGLDILNRLTADPEWGAGALRALLFDAVKRNDPAGMARWAQALYRNPRHTVGDMADCLAALSRADATGYAEAVAGLKKDHLASPEAAAQLVGWLNQIGKSAEALDWLGTLPEPNVKRPPLAVAKSEALRCMRDWTALQAWVSAGEWGKDLDFLKWSYGLFAAKKNGDEAREQEFWRTLKQNAQLNSPHALFAGTTLFSWGAVKEAEELWWLAASANNNVSIEALGTLARYYQVQRDAAGQYRVFNQLHALRPNDDAVSNNLAFFAALTGNREQLAEQLARDNFARHPGDPVFQSTYAFVLIVRGKGGEALAKMEPLKAEAERSAAVTLAYGLALASTGEKARAREMLHRLDPSTLTAREVELINATLGD